MLLILYNHILLYYEVIHLFYIINNNNQKYNCSFILLRKIFKWVYDNNPSQPVTAAPWRFWLNNFDIQKTKTDKLYIYMFENSDIISFHAYTDIENTKKIINNLKIFNRPIFCTEYMARLVGL